MIEVKIIRTPVSHKGITVKLYAFSAIGDAMEQLTIALEEAARGDILQIDIRK